MAVGSDGFAYVAAMDTAGAIWIAHFNEAGWGTWYTAPAIFARSDGVSANHVDLGPKLAAGTDRIFAVGLDPNGDVWINSFLEGIGNRWGTWTYTNSTLFHFAPAAIQNNLYIAGESADRTLWWYSAASGWNPYGQLGTNTDVIATVVAAAPH